MTRKSIAAAGVIAAVAGFASAGPITATFTADNHYAIFTRSHNTFSLVSGNETGASGSTGGYNWSAAETHLFDATGWVYIAAWSDKSVAQGLIGQLTTASETILSGDLRWDVLSTGVDRTTGDPYPTVAEMTSWVLAGDDEYAWESPHIGGANGLAPWGTIAGVSGTARWMWRNSEEVSNPLLGGNDHGELLIFRIPVSAIPAPGPIALAGLGGLMLARRRRS